MIKAKARRLTPQQSKLVDEFFKCDNQQAAALASGYTESGARNIWRTFAKPQVAEEVQRRLQRMSMSADRAVYLLSALAEFDPVDFHNADGSLRAIHDVPPQARKALAGLEVVEEFEGRGEARTQVGWNKKIKFVDRVRVLELLAKYHKLLTDKVEATGADGAPLSIVFNLSPASDGSKPS